MKKFTKENAGEWGTDKLSYKYKKDTPGQSSNGKTMKEKQSDTNLDIKSLEKLIKSPSPRMVKMYGKSKYIDMLKKKLAKLKEEKEDFEPHMMYDPKTGKARKANSHDDHLRLKKMGYSHEKPTEVEEADGCWDGFKKVGMKKKGDKTVPNCVPEENIEEATELYKKGKIALTKFAMGKGKGAGLQINYGTKFIQVPEKDIKQLAQGITYVTKSVPQFKEETEIEEGFYADDMSPKEKKRLNSIYKEMDKVDVKIDAAIKKGDAKTVDKLGKEKQKLTMQVVNFFKEDVELEEAIKFWTVTITKKAGKLFKGQTVDVKARNSAEAIKKGIKQMKGNPALIPGGSVDAVLGESRNMDFEKANELTYDEYDEVKNFRNFNKKDWKRNVIQKKYVRIKKVKESINLEEAKGSVIAQVKAIVANKQASKIGGKMIDMQTASFISQIYDKVSSTIKKKMEKDNIGNLVKIAQKVMAKESTDIEENIGVKDGRRVVVKALTKPAALRLKKKLRNKFSSWDTSIDKDGLSMIVPNEKPIVRYIKQQPEVDTIGESTEIHENKETESELQEAAPFKSLEQKWLATKGDEKKQGKLIKKHSLKPIISKVRPGAVKLGVLNDLNAKGSNNATAAGLDADGELIFVTNNPTKIYYAKKGSKRPKGLELEDVDLDALRLQRMVEVAVGSKDNAFIIEAGVDLTWSPSMIQKEYKKYLGNS